MYRCIHERARERWRGERQRERRNAELSLRWCSSSSAVDGTADSTLQQPAMSKQYREYHHAAKIECNTRHKFREGGWRRRLKIADTHSTLGRFNIGRVARRNFQVYSLMKRKSFLGIGWALSLTLLRWSAKWICYISLPIIALYNFHFSHFFFSFLCSRRKILRPMSGSGLLTWDGDLKVHSFKNGRKLLSSIQWMFNSCFSFVNLELPRFPISSHECRVSVQEIIQTNSMASLIHILHLVCAIDCVEFGPLLPGRARARHLSFSQLRKKKRNFFIFPPLRLFRRLFISAIRHIQRCIACHSTHTLRCRRRR